MRGSQFAELVAFVAVAEHGNFTRAAAQLEIASATLSETIRSLEERLGVRLFNRTTRSVALTEAGERLLAELRPVLGGLDHAIEAVDAFRGTPAGKLRLLVSRQAATMMIVPLMPQFLREYPEIRLEIVADDADRDIVDAHFDAGVRLGERIERDMITMRLFDAYRMVAIAAPAYARAHQMPLVPNDLRAHDCIRQREDWDGAIHPWVFEKTGERIEIAVDGHFVINDTPSVLSAAVDGIGVAYLSEPMVLPHIADGRLVRVLEDWCTRRQGLFLYHPSRRQIPAPLQAFLDFMRKQRRPKIYPALPRPSPPRDGIPTAGDLTEAWPVSDAL
ncbi:transcriptional regulator, LysR family [Rhizobiales bacterium GAS191]|jgi:DNA-binding transcriptional LysR family regulator|nr:transcriptional regulator, LysR family [Rhizobiales bacterium GAS113]SEC19948.1 transcriptional regulator, LysR family [Rhizobiales bacterium GAS188]SED04143.1 transcriptional regulator, LysR family [Rhizobiales bacterium GAS191]